MVSPVDAEAPSSRDYFELFQIPVAFDVDVDDLARRFKLLQKQFHPDRFAGKSAAEQRVAAQMSAELNAGYQTLKHEVKRAGYMLQRYGVDLSQLEREPVDGEFLLQQIELREQAEALREEATSRDATSSNNFTNLLLRFTRVTWRPFVLRLAMGSLSRRVRRGLSCCTWRSCGGSFPPWVARRWCLGLDANRRARRCRAGR